MQSMLAPIDLISDTIPGSGSFDDKLAFHMYRFRGEPGAGPGHPLFGENEVCPRVWAHGQYRSS